MVPVRKALLIISGGDSECQIPAQRIRRFLFSPMGGGWLPSEIHTLINPDITTLTTILGEMNGDYTMTFFVGPSFYDDSRRRFLMVNPMDFIQADELINAAPRQLLLIDALTHNSDLPIYATGTAYERIVARNVYSRWLERTPPGIVSLQADDTPSDFDPGFLTQLLLSIGAPNATTDRPLFKTILGVGLTMNHLYRRMGLEPRFVLTASGNPGMPFGLVLPHGVNIPRVPARQAAFRKLFDLLFNTEI
jgi:hypothetical protein